MLNNFLKEVIVYLGGIPAEQIVDLLNTKKYINEFLIAKKMDLTVNQTRNILYKISDKGLVSSIRKKDKKKGWYTYFWKIEILKSLEFLKQILLNEIEQTNDKIKDRKTNQFYVCKRCNIEVDEKTALFSNFTCDECGDVFKLKDNSKLLNKLGKDLAKFKSKLVFVDKEIEKEKGKLEKIKAKETKKLEKEKIEKRAQQKAARAKIAGSKLKILASSAKINKKPIKKKPVKKKKPTKKIKKKVSKKKKLIKKKSVKKIKKLKKKGKK